MVSPETALKDLSKVLPQLCAHMVAAGEHLRKVQEVLSDLQPCPIGDSSHIRRFALKALLGAEAGELTIAPGFNSSIEAKCKGYRFRVRKTSGQRLPEASNGQISRDFFNQVPPQAAIPGLDDEDDPFMANILLLWDWVLDREVGHFRLALPGKKESASDSCQYYDWVIPVEISQEETEDIFENIPGLSFTDHNICDADMSEASIKR